MSQSAGGVVVNEEGKVLVVSQRGDSWSLPKGHLDEGETEEMAARREIKEESGIQELNILKKLGSYERFRIGKGGVGEDPSSLKHITMFLFSTEQTELKPEDPENPEARWVDVEKVSELLTHKKDKAFFESIKSEIL